MIMIDERPERVRRGDFPKPQDLSVPCEMLHQTLQGHQESDRRDGAEEEDDPLHPVRPERDHHEEQTQNGDQLETIPGGLRLQADGPARDRFLTS